MDAPRTVEFVAHERITAMVPMLDAFKFAPSGRARWLQRLAWRFLQWRGALAQAYEPKTTIRRHTIDADRFIERVFKQKRALLEGFNRDGQRLLIGSEDYFDLMGELSINEHFSFTAQVGYDRQLVGLKVEVIPWMRGAVVMP